MTMCGAGRRREWLVFRVHASSRNKGLTRGIVRCLGTKHVGGSALIAYVEGICP